MKVVMIVDQSEVQVGDFLHRYYMREYEWIALGIVKTIEPLASGGNRFTCEQLPAPRTTSLLLDNNETSYAGEQYLVMREG